MKVYSYDNKMLSVNGKCLSPKASSETWVLNVEVTLIPINIAVIFISNTNNFYGISTGSGDLNYWSDPNGDDALTVFEDENRGWLDEAYRTITFLKAPTGDLLTWLQNNGVKQ